MKSRFFFIFAATLFFAVVVPAPLCQAGCWCGLDYCPNDAAFVVDDTKTEVWTTEVVKTSATQSNGSCPAPGRVAPTKTCSVSGATSNTYEWQVSGSMTYALFGVTGQTGQTVNQTLGSGCDTVINSWCSCCYVKAYEKYKHTRKEGLCWCVSPICFSGSSYSATMTEFQGLHCTDEPQCVVPSNCNSICPLGE